MIVSIMGRMKELVMMLEYQNEDLQKCEKKDLIDLVTMRFGAIERLCGCCG